MSNIFIYDDCLPVGKIIPLFSVYVGHALFAKVCATCLESVLSGECSFCENIEICNSQPEIDQPFLYSTGGEGVVFKHLAFIGKREGEILSESVIVYFCRI